MKIAPSLLSADFLNLQNEIEKVEIGGADFLHLDVMDGHFVPNLTFGSLIVEKVAKATKLPLDIHLMVENVGFFVEMFLPFHPRFISFHLEEEKHIHRLIHRIRECGVSPAIALNPHTPIHLLDCILPDVDMVLLMSVNPGFGGQKFIPSVLEKIRKLKAMIEDKNPSCLIEVDGGVNQNNAFALKEAGTDILVAGSYIFGSCDYANAISSLKGLFATYSN